MSTDQAVTAQPRRHLRDLPIYRKGLPFLGTEIGIVFDPLTLHMEPYRRYGAIYRIRFNYSIHLVMAGPEANEFVWRNGKLWLYSEGRRGFKNGFDETCIFQLDGETHRKKRRRMTPGFKLPAILPHVESMGQAVERRISALPDGRADLRHLCVSMAVGMTCQGLLQMDLPKGMDDDLEAYPQQLLFGTQYGVLRFLPSRSKEPPYLKLKHSLVERVDEMLTKHDTSLLGEDMHSMMLKTHPDEQPPTREELIYDILFLLEAGTGTSANLMLWTLMYIYDHPDWLAELREELASWSPARFQRVEDWPKLMASLLEAERLRPPVPFFILYPDEDFEFQDVHVPRMTPIFHPAALPHFLPEIYADPLTYKPQRFVTANACPHKTHSTYGGGKHFCLGQTLARMQIMLAVAHIVTNYDIAFDVKHSFKTKMHLVVTPVEPAVSVRFVPRRATV